MDTGSVVVTVFFIILTAICIAAAKNLLGVSFLAACLIGAPSAFGIGMAIIWLLARFGSKRR